ncbi:head decoration protein [Azospirillum argentinense]|uniref:Head decoration protein n=2 Tax=Azospirillum TaxID=191 RepID=A0A4D8QH11_AZOBR|nr:head decoration protein [Azospirillum argentinense]PNQ94975.1 head decoration protein [Azospirillum argentinense]QCO07530.1 head decoration protein [Azospirillum argentinense]
MAALTEGRHAAEFVLSEGNRSISRDAVTIVSGAGQLAAGTVLGKIAASGKYEPATAAAADPATGSETAVAVLLYPVDATAADVTAAAITRFAEVNTTLLAYDDTVNDAAKRAAKIAQLAAVGIIAR